MLCVEGLLTPRSQGTLGLVGVSLDLISYAKTFDP
jgi:hypothetical protein